MNILLSALTNGQAIAAVVAVVILVLAVIVIASILSKQKKSKKATETQSANEQTQTSQTVAADLTEQDNEQSSIDAKEQTVDEAVGEEEQAVADDNVVEEEEQLAEDTPIVEEIQAVENDNIVEEVAIEEKTVSEEEQQPLEEEPAEEAQPVVETHPFAEAKPAEEEKKTEEKKAVEKPVEEKKPIEQPVKKNNERERTVIIDDKPVLIKDDRFLFNPEEDGFYYVLEKTFTAKLIQSSETVKDYYTELKNELLSYKKVHSRMSKKRESFNFGRNCLARLTVRGKTLRLHLALDANTYEETKYKVEDTSEIKSLADTPLLYRIRNDRRLKYAKDLIAAVMEKYGVQKQEIEPINYTANYPYEATEVLIEKGLITKRRVQGRMPEGNGFEFAQKTFKAKLIQSEEYVKEYYSQLKNHLLTYRKIHDRMSKNRESYRFGRICVARMSIRGKTLKLYLALNATDYEDTKYKVEDASSVKSYADTPLLYKIKNTRRLNYAKDLIDVMMTNLGVSKKRESDEKDYAADLPYESTEELLEEGLIVNRFVSGNSFIAQHFKHKEVDPEMEAAADETD
ncbi:MAG: hypothetical protein K2N57_05920 [Clostridia bacterium]|nr:hypothetical protein [Clostridia bacterium]